VSTPTRAGSRRPGAGGLQCPEDPVHRATRFAVDALAGDHDDPPAGLVELLPALEVALPVLDSLRHRIRDEHGEVLRRFDLSYPALRLIVEYDGRQPDAA
jgi:hypothetical protein